MIAPTLIGEALFWSPLIIIGILALIISPYYWTVFAAVYFVWVTILPAIPIQLLFIFTTHKIIQAVRRKKNGN